MRGLPGGPVVKNLPANARNEDATGIGATKPLTSCVPLGSHNY